MRLLTFRRNGADGLGVLRPGQADEVVELKQPPDMLTLIEAGDEGLTQVRAALSSSRTTTHRLQDIELLAPLTPPLNIVAIGRNYGKHAEENAKQDKDPEPPTNFTTAIKSLTHPQSNS